jgi:hypothetical protein
MSGSGGLEGLISLFNGEVRGSVVNPYTGTLMMRRDVLDLYRFLIKKFILDPDDSWTQVMVQVTRELLGIPSDLHLELVKAFKSKGIEHIDDRYKDHVMDEVESIRFFRNGFCHKGENGSGTDPKPVKEGSESFDQDPLGSDILEVDKGSLIDQMEVEEGIDMGAGSAFSADYMVFDEPGLMSTMEDSIHHRSQKR